MKKQRDTWEIEKFCAFCEHASELITESEFLCAYKGVVGARFSCRKFMYDPLKRKPKRKSGSKEDFEPIDITFSAIGQEPQNEEEKDD